MTYPIKFPPVVTTNKDPLYIRVSKKLTVLMITFALIMTTFFLSIYYAQDLGLYCFITALVSTQLSIVLGCVTYITGQAKIDVDIQASENVGIKK